MKRVLKSIFPEKEETLLPFSFYAKMRQEAPVLFDKELGVWGVFKYEDVKSVLSDNLNFSRISENAHIENKFLDLTKLSLHHLDPPQHTRLHQIVASVFTKKMQLDLEPQIVSLLKNKLNLLETLKEFDMVSEVATPLSLMTISSFLAIPSEDQHRLLDWMEKYNSFGPPEWESSYRLRQEALDEMSRYFLSLTKQRKEIPGDDLVSKLLVANVQGETMSLEEVAGFCCLLVITNDVLNLFIGNALYCLLNNQEVSHILQTKPELIPLAVEEILRYLGPTQGMNRRALKNTMIRDKRIKKGETVIAWIGSANHDELVFEKPDQLIVTRDPNPHIAFGYGIHYCMGAPLARLVGKIVLSIFPHFLARKKLVLQNQLERLPNLMFFGFKQLLVHT
jgi:cytochrome P450